MPRRDVIVLGASAGGLQPLREIVCSLPADLPAAVLVVLHTSPGGPGLLGSLLSAVGRLPAATARDGEDLLPGRVYTAPPDLHLIVRRHRISTVRGPKENRHRPAVDPLFRSAARSFGARVVAVVLSGNLDDGAHGLEVVKERSGLAVVQDPRDAAVPGMPLAALDRVAVDHCLPARDIGPLLADLAGTEVEAGEVWGEEEGTPVDEVEGLERGLVDRGAGSPSGLTCPDCHGALWRLEEGHTVRYRCRVGHGFTEEGLLTTQSETLEDALWAALRILEERAELLRRMVQRVDEARQERVADLYRADLEEVQQQMRLLRRALLPESEGARSGSDD